MGLIDTLRADFAQQGFQTRIAIADTWGAAWAISHFGSTTVCVIPAAQQSQALAALPVRALRIADAVIESLQTLDVSTIGRLMRLPRTTLPSRFGKELLRRLDQALGSVPELLTAERLVEPFHAQWLFDEPIANRQTLDHILGVLLDQILGQLNDRRASLREVVCHWLGTARAPVSLRLLLPTTDRRHLLELLRLQCERQVFTGGVSGIRMEVVEMGLPAVRQTQLFEDGDDKDERQHHALAELIDRLSSRLGRQAVLRPSLCPDPQPEYACESVLWLGGAIDSTTEPPVIRSHLRCRPLRLLRSPLPLIVQTSPLTGLPTRIDNLQSRLASSHGEWISHSPGSSSTSRVSHSQVMRVAGPERIETGWWRGPDAKRDYYRLDLDSGAALWAFVKRDTGNWFLHGLFV